MSDKLVLEFGDAQGKSIFMVYDYAADTAEADDIKELMNTIIANGDIFSDIPVTKKSAKIIAVYEYEKNIS